jgi:hypothetical protein
LKNLPRGAIRIGVQTFNRVLAETDDEEQARRAAWSNVKARYRKVGEKWVRKSGTEAPEALVSIELTITKASIRDGKQFWALTASDTQTDRMGDATSLELFEDWIRRAYSGETEDWLPEPEMPFLGLSHYGRQGGFNEAGLPDRLYIDGRQFKASGEFSAGPIGQALFSVIRDERAQARKGNPPDNPVRISAAWWDIQHAHDDRVFTRKSLLDLCPMCLAGQGNRQFMKGQLDHFAGTRVPINPRTEIGLQEKAMAVTRNEDAASIVDQELADELERREREELETRSDAESTSAALMVKADDDQEPAEPTAAFNPEVDLPPQVVLVGTESVLPAGESEVDDEWRQGDEIVDPVVALVEELPDDDPEVTLAVTKMVRGKKYPAGDFLVVEDADSPDTWHLQVKRNGRPNARLMGAAWAALGPKGFRGKKYKGPKKGEAKRKLRGLYKQEGREPPGQTKAGAVLVEGEPIGYWLPYGGATSIADAVAYREAQDRLTDFYRAWDMHQAVVDNIQRTHSAEEIPEAMMTANDEFAALVATMKAEHLAEQAEGAIEMSQSSQQQASTVPAQPAVTPASTDGTDWLAVFRSEVETALGQTPQSREQREQRIQVAFNQLAETITGQLNTVSPPDLMAEVRAAVSDVMSPLADSVAYLMALAQQRPDPQMRPQQPVPQQRSMMPAPAITPTSQAQPLQSRAVPISPVTGQPSTLTQIVRRSVGIREGAPHQPPVTPA